MSAGCPYCRMARLTMAAFIAGAAMVAGAWIIFGG